MSSFQIIGPYYESVAKKDRSILDAVHKVRPLEEETCLEYKQICTESKPHFLMYCQGYSTLRRELHSHDLDTVALYTSLSNNEKFRYLFRADNKVTIR